MQKEYNAKGKRKNKKQKNFKRSHKKPDDLQRQESSESEEDVACMDVR